MSTNLRNRERERQRERENGWQTSEGRREKERQKARAREKKRRHFLLEEQHENFVAVARKWKMLTKVKIRGRRKKVNKNTYDISSIKRVTRKFLTTKKCTKKVCITCKVAILLISRTVVFSPFSLPSPLSITRFYILFEQTINIIETFAFSPG